MIFEAIIQEKAERITKLIEENVEKTKIIEDNVIIKTKSIDNRIKCDTDIEKNTKQDNTHQLQSNENKEKS